MSTIKFTSRELAVAAGLAAISAVTQLVHIGYQSPQWGMWIDVVAVSWIIAFFLYGVRISAVVSILGAIIITLFAPDTWLGAVMKWTATMPMWLSLYLFTVWSKKKISDYQKAHRLFLPLIFGLVIRSIIVLPINYYFAIPIWTGMTAAAAIAAIPWWIIVLFNSIQGIIDVILAWMIVFRFRISRFANWDNNQ